MKHVTFLILFLLSACSAVEPEVDIGLAKEVAGAPAVEALGTDPFAPACKNHNARNIALDVASGYCGMPVSHCTEDLDADVWKPHPAKRPSVYYCQLNLQGPYFPGCEVWLHDEITNFYGATKITAELYACQAGGQPCLRWWRFDCDCNGCHPIQCNSQLGTC